MTGHFYYLLTVMLTWYVCYLRMPICIPVCLFLLFHCITSFYLHLPVVTFLRCFLVIFSTMISYICIRITDIKIILPFLLEIRVITHLMNKSEHWFCLAFLYVMPMRGFCCTAYVHLGGKALSSLPLWPTIYLLPLTSYTHCQSSCEYFRIVFGVLCSIRNSVM